MECDYLRKGGILDDPNFDVDKRSSELIETVENLSAFENKKGLEERFKLLEQLQESVRVWVDKTKNPLNDSVSSVDGYGAKVLAFGGQAIGIVPTGGDLDALCIVPYFVMRHHFFDSLPDILTHKLNANSLRKVESAHVPVLQFTVQNIKVDLSLAITRLERIAEDVDYTEDSFQAPMDVVSVRSMSGVRDAALLLSLVPDTDTFINVLKTIKLWAKNRGLHNSAMGMPGGIAWTIMVCYICQRHPEASVCQLVHLFFMVFTHWKWPKPVKIRELMEGGDTLYQWDPHNVSDGHHNMPVITPAYPEHNCTFVVAKSTRDVIKSQLNEGAKMCKKILMGEVEWKALFQPIAFFDMYKHFLMVSSSCPSEEEDLVWTCYVESQIRKLVEILEESETALQRIHIYTKRFRKTLADEIYTRWFIGLKISKTAGSSLDLSQPSLDFVATVTSVGEDRRIWRQGMNVEVIHVPRRDVDRYVMATESS